MNGLLALIRKELWQQFKTPVAYVVIAGFCGFWGLWLFGVMDFFAVGRASLRELFVVAPYLMAVVGPAVTMRSWSEERRSGTAETLLSMPVAVGSIVIAKFFAALITVLTAVAATLLVPVLISPFGTFDAGEITAQYLGLVLLATASVSVGQFGSAFGRSQMVAFIFSSALLFLIALAQPLSGALGYEGVIAQLLRMVSSAARLDSLNRGLLDFADLTYFLVVSALSLLATVMIVARRKAR